MTVLEIEGRRVEVDDAFLSMTPEQQGREVDDIARQLSIQPQSQQAKPHSVMAGGQDASPPTGEPLDGGTVRPPNVTPTDQSQFTPEQLEMGKRFRERGGEDFQRDQFAAQHPAASKAATFLQGVPFLGEFLDELAGLVSDNPEATKLVRAMQEREMRESPITATGLQVAGGLTAAVPAIAAAGPAIVAGAPASMAGKVAAGVGAGAVGGGVEGTVSGFGSGTDPESRKENAINRGLVGTVSGGAFGGVAPPLAKGGEAVAKGAMDIANRFRGQSAEGVSQAAQDVIGRALGPEAQTAQAGVNMARGGPDAMLADATQGTRDLLDTSIAKSGPAASVAKQAVEDRAARANQTMRSVLDDVLGTPQGISRTERALNRGSAVARRQAYQAAYETPIDYASSAGMALEQLFERVPASAFAVANRLMKAEGVQSRQLFKRLNTSGKVIEESTLPDVRQIDYLTRALREVSDKEDGKGKLGGVTQLGRVYRNLASDIRTLAKQLVPEYGRALDVAADPISRRAALRNGQKYLSPSVARDDAEEIVQGMTGAELANLKQGIRSNIDNQMANVKRIVSDPNQDARQARKALAELSSDAAREKMALILSPAEQQRLFREIDRSSLGLELKAAVAANSKTQIRNATQRVIEDFSQGGALRQGFSGQPVMSAKRVVQVATKNTPEDRIAREDELYSEIVRTLTVARGAEAKILLRTLANINLREPIRVGQAKAVGRIIAGAAVLPAHQTTVQTLGR